MEEVEPQLSLPPLARPLDPSIQNCETARQSHRTTAMSIQRAGFSAMRSVRLAMASSSSVSRPTPCSACDATRRLHTRSNARPVLRSAASRPRPSPILIALRHHANRARDSSDSAAPERRPPGTAEDQHKLSEAASKATQQHSGPEGHQKEHHSSGDVSKVTEVSEKEQGRKDWEIIKTLLPNVWPRNDWGTKTRVLLAIGLLIGGKVSRSLSVSPAGRGLTLLHRSY